MNKGIIDQSALEKDIEKIIFYSGEEKASLSKIKQRLEDSCNSYMSSNKELLLNNFNKLNTTIDKITIKRDKYSSVLKKVIIKYNTLSEKTKMMFEGDNNYGL